jgi:hypothetical protein
MWIQQARELSVALWKEVGLRARDPGSCSGIAVLQHGRRSHVYAVA